MGGTTASICGKCGIELWAGRRDVLWQGGSGVSVSTRGGSVCTGHRGKVRAAQVAGDKRDVRCLMSGMGAILFPWSQLCHNF